MYYVRTFEGGGAFYDPRRQKYAEFKCDLCGHLHHVNLSQYPNYDLTKIFPCKNAENLIKMMKLILYKLKKIIFLKKSNKRKREF